MPPDLQIQDHFNFDWLNVPIGKTGWVEDYLATKSGKLQNTIDLIAGMPHLHEAYWILKNCASVMKVVHILRTTPPGQLRRFIQIFDDMEKVALEKIIGTDRIEDAFWKVAKLPPKFGGLGFRTGLEICGAQYIMSVIKCTAGIRRFAADWDPAKVIRADALKWLEKSLGVPIEVDKLVNSMLVSESVGSGNSLEGITGVDCGSLSLAQVCELREQQRVFASLSKGDKLHVQANSGPTQGWISLAPLKWKGNNLRNVEFKAIWRRRLRIPLINREGHCQSCNMGCALDIYGDHAIICRGWGSLIVRHEIVKSLLGDEIRNAGYKVT